MEVAWGLQDSCAWNFPVQLCVYFWVANKAFVQRRSDCSVRTRNILRFWLTKQGSLFWTTLGCESMLQAVLELHRNAASFSAWDFEREWGVGANPRHFASHFRLVTNWQLSSAKCTLSKWTATWRKAIPGWFRLHACWAVQLFLCRRTFLPQVRINCQAFFRKWTELQYCYINVSWCHPVRLLFNTHVSHTHIQGRYFIRHLATLYWDPCHDGRRSHCCYFISRESRLTRCGSAYYS